MKSYQLTKKLNNTELGKTGTHDTYILVPQDVDVSDIFPEANTFYDFTDKESGETVSIRMTQGREKRIVGLGQYYSRKDLCAGDEIVLERWDICDETKRFVDYFKQMNRLMLQKSKNGFEILTPERQNLLSEEVQVDGQDVSLSFIESRKKRQDSPEETDFYDFRIDGQSMIDHFKNNEIVEVEVVNSTARINRFCAWKKAFMEMEDNE